MVVECGMDHVYRGDSAFRDEAGTCGSATDIPTCTAGLMQKKSENYAVRPMLCVWLWSQMVQKYCITYVKDVDYIVFVLVHVPT